MMLNVEKELSIAQIVQRSKYKNFENSAEYKTENNSNKRYNNKER